MSDVVITSNISIKIDKIGYLNNLAAGAGTNFVAISANSNQYFEIDYFSLSVASGSCTWDIYSPDLATVLYQSGSQASHAFNGVSDSVTSGSRKFFKVPNGCQLRITTPAASTTIKISGSVFMNSP